MADPDPAPYAWAPGNCRHLESGGNQPHDSSMTDHTSRPGNTDLHRATPFLG